MNTNSSRPLPFAIITDAAPLGDDGVAISMLLASPRIDIKLIVCASGNFWAEDVAVNVRALLARFKRTDIPVVVGLPASAHFRRVESFVARLQVTKMFYSGALARPIPPSTSAHSDGYKELAAAIRDTKALNIFIAGPPSAAVAAIHEAKKDIKNIGRVFMMGGALHVRGNATPKAEFNFWFDPEAADSILGSGLDITLVPLDATDRLRYSETQIKSLPSDRPGAAYLKEYIATRKVRSKNPLHIWDEALSAIVLDRGLIESCSIVRLRVATRQLDYGKLEFTSDAE